MKKTPGDNGSTERTETTDCYITTSGGPESTRDRMASHNHEWTQNPWSCENANVNTYYFITIWLV